MEALCYELIRKVAIGVHHLAVRFLHQVSALRCFELVPLSLFFALALRTPF